MSLRILFVDDEPNVLDGLRRTLRGFRQEWDMRFAQGGQAALLALAETPVDVVVSDMRMPGMDGDELLTQVRQQFPQTVRIVLTGECSREALVRVSGIAHRILTKPCDPVDLRAAVAQMSSLLNLLQNPRLSAAVGRLKSVPTRTDLYARILATLSDPDSSISELGRVFGSDVGVSAKLIQLANSAVFGGRQQVTTLLDAVLRIGEEMTKAVVLADGVLTQFDPRSIHPYTIDDVWPHSRKVAVLAARIAHHEAGEMEWVRQTASVGILHDIGRLVLASAEPVAYVSTLRRVESDGVFLVDAEREQFNVTHAEVGAYLLGVWGVPTSIVEAVAWHHSPQPSSHPTGKFSLTTAVHAAEVILAPEEGGGPDLEYLDRIGAADRMVDWAALAGDSWDGEAR